MKKKWKKNLPYQRKNELLLQSITETSEFDFENTLFMG